MGFSWVWPALAALAPLAYMAYTDVRWRLVDVRALAALGVIAAWSASTARLDLAYILSLTTGAVVAVAKRLAGAGLGDSLVVALVGAIYTPMPTSMMVIALSGAPLIATIAWLLAVNRRRGCVSGLHALTRFCAEPAELIESPHRFAPLDARDLERLDLGAVRRLGEEALARGERFVVVRYGVPYVAHLAVAYAIYLIVILLWTSP